MTEKKNYRAKAASGERDKLYPVFPGIWLAFQEVETYSFSPWGKVPSGLLEITHCREGRLEYQDSCQAFFLGEGDLSIRQTRKEEAALLGHLIPEQEGDHGAHGNGTGRGCPACGYFRYRV